MESVDSLRHDKNSECLKLHGNSPNKIETGINHAFKFVEEALTKSNDDKE